MITREPAEGGACDTESEGEEQEYEYDIADRLIGEGISYDDFGRITSLPGHYAGGGTLQTTYCPMIWSKADAGRHHEHLRARSRPAPAPP